MLQINSLWVDYAIEMSFGEITEFFISSNGIFIVVMIAFSLCMAFKNQHRNLAFKAFSWTALLALLYYSFSVLKAASVLMVSYYDAPAVILSLMLYIPHIILCALFVSLLFDFGKSIKISCILALLSFFVSTFFLIFHVSCVMSQMVAFSSSYDVFAQFTNIFSNVLLFAVSSLFFCITRSKEMFDAFMLPYESDSMLIENNVSGAD